jgi:putative ABC transport system permease protein
MRIFGVRPSILVRFYRWRLREHGVQELLAAAGIAIGVALVFGVLVANTSLTASAEQLVDGVVGSARIQLAARSADGYDERIAQAASRVPGIAHSAPTLRANVTLVGPNGGRRSIQLFGVTTDLAALGGVTVKDFGPGGLRLSDGITLPSALADAIGARPGTQVRLLAAGRTRRVIVGSVLGPAVIGSLSESPVGITLLPVAQRLTGRDGRISQLLVEPRAGADASVTRELERLAQGRLYVGPATAELQQIDLTAKPNDQSTLLFAAIGAVVGLLFAVNASLMTTPERRRFVAELRTQGFDPRQVLAILAFEATVLGCVASLLGLAIGALLAETLFDRVPAYLAFAFPIGTQRVVTFSTVLIAFGGGVLATLVASIPPALDLRRGKGPIDAVLREASDEEAGEGIDPRTTKALFAAGLGIIAVATCLVLLVPHLTVVAAVMLAFAGLCFIPVVFTAVSRPLERVGRRLRGSMLAIAVIELRATRLRSIALAAVGAIAVYGSVAIEGAHHDLVNGLDENFGEYLGTADLWITTGGDDLTTNSFAAGALPQRISQLPGVADVRAYQGGLLDAGDHRLWIVARAPTDRAMIPASQMVEGDLDRATARIRAGGWAAVSDVFARGRDVDVGDRFMLPTPTGAMTLQVAAITTNLGWPPGGIIMSSRDFRRAWDSADPAALQVDLEPGASPAEAKAAVTRALGSTAALRVQTRDERRAQYAALSRQGLTSLTQISTLLLVAAALAVASALGAAIWQRRPRLAALKVQGFDERQLWRALLLESGIVLTIGFATGAVLGIYGHLLASRYLETTTGFPAPFSVAGDQLLLTLAIVVGIALFIVAVPGWLAAKAPPSLSFQDQK